MMRILLSLSLIALSTVTSMAQIRIGLKVAPQITWSATDNKNTSSNGTRINASYGLMVDYFFTENYAIGTEVCVASFGTNLNLNKNKYTSVMYAGTTYPNSDDVKFDYKLAYFNIPLLVKMRTNEMHGLRYYAEFGFGLGFLYRSKADISFGNTSLSNVDVNDPDPSDDYRINYASGSTISRYDDDVSAVRTSMIIGAGIHYHFHQSSAIVVGLRYDNGLSGFTVSDDWQTTLNGLGLNLGLLF